MEKMKIRYMNGKEEERKANKSGGKVDKYI
jgi:hypothetical protein